MARKVTHKFYEWQNAGFEKKHRTLLGDKAFLEKYIPHYESYVSVRLVLMLSTVLPIVTVSIATAAVFGVIEYIKDSDFGLYIGGYFWSRGNLSRIHLLPDFVFPDTVL